MQDHANRCEDKATKEKAINSIKIKEKNNEELTEDKIFCVCAHPKKNKI